MQPSWFPAHASHRELTRGAVRLYRYFSVPRSAPIVSVVIVPVIWTSYRTTPTNVIYIMCKLRTAIAVIVRIRAFSSVETIFSDISPVKNRASATVVKRPAVACRAQSEISASLAPRPNWKETKKRMRKLRLIKNSRNCKKCIKTTPIGRRSRGQSLIRAV